MIKKVFENYGLWAVIKTPFLAIALAGLVTTDNISLLKFYAVFLLVCCAIDDLYLHLIHKELNRIRRMFLRE